ncbi:hypothetical protein [Hymenobacter fastidiosus]
MLRPLAGPEIQEAYALLPDASRQHGCPHWLIDLRRDISYRPELLTTFFPSPAIVRSS